MQIPLTNLEGQPPPKSSPGPSSDGPACFYNRAVPGALSGSSDFANPALARNLDHLACAQEAGSCRGRGGREIRRAGRRLPLDEVDPPRGGREVTLADLGSAVTRSGAAAGLKPLGCSGDRDVRNRVLRPRFGAAPRGGLLVASERGAREGDERRSVPKPRPPFERSPSRTSNRIP